MCRHEPRPSDALTIASGAHVAAQFHWDPETYLEMIRGEVPRYEELQDAGDRGDPVRARAVLELGFGTAETTRRIWERYPETRITGLDSSPEMVFKARQLGWEEMRLARMEDPLPDGPWDLVIAVLSVHHLDADGKRDLFRRVREQSRALVIGDVVEVPPERRVDADRPGVRPALARRRAGRVVRRRDRLGGRRPRGDPRGLRPGLIGVARSRDLELAGDVLVQALERQRQPVVELAGADRARELRRRRAGGGARLLGRRVRRIAAAEQLAEEAGVG